MRKNLGKTTMMSNHIQPFIYFHIFWRMQNPLKKKKHTVSIFIFQNWMLIFTTFSPLVKPQPFHQRNPNHSSLPAIRNHPAGAPVVGRQCRGVFFNTKKCEREIEKLLSSVVFIVFFKYWVCVLQQLAIFRCDDWFKSAVFWWNLSTKDHRVILEANWGYS